MKASPELSHHLQAVLVDLIALSLQGNEAHWTVVGPNFRDLHLLLDEITMSARLLADKVAERMRALGAEPDGRSGTVAESTTLAEFPPGLLTTDLVVKTIGDRLRSSTATVRAVHDPVDTEDPTTADLLHEILEALEQFHWLLTAEHPELRPSPV